MKETEKIEEVKKVKEVQKMKEVEKMKKVKNILSMYERKFSMQKNYSRLLPFY